jgi:hypothetical protein
MSVLLKIIKAEKENTVKKEAVWVFGNALSCGSNPQIEYLYSLNILPLLCKLINSNDPEIVQISLDSINSILKYASNVNRTDIEAQLTSDFETLKQIERLTKSPNKSVFVKAETIIRILKKVEVQGLKEQ